MDHLINKIKSAGIEVKLMTPMQEKFLKKYSTKKTYTWKPTKKGTYKIIVYAKDGSGKTVKKSVTIKVKKK